MLDREACIDKACDIIEEAASNGARLIVFPEEYIGGYPYWVFLTNPIDSADMSVELIKQSITIPGKDFDRLCAVARKHKIHVIMGANEVDGDASATIYNTIIFIDENGNYLGKHRKLMPTIGQRLVHHVGDGTTLKVYPTAVGNLGGLICGEHRQLLSRYALIARGEQVHASLWPAIRFRNEKGHEQTIDAAIRHHAREGQLFVVCSTGFLDKETIDRLADTPEKRELLGEGGGWAAIVDPMGRYIAGPLEGEEGIVYAEIDLDAILEAKLLWDTLGNYARWDVWRLQLREEEWTPIVGWPTKKPADLLTALRRQVSRSDAVQLIDQLEALLAENHESPAGVSVLGGGNRDTPAGVG